VAYLRIYTGDTFLEQRELSSKRISIGRAKDSDIVLKNRGVSKHHAIIEKNGESFVLIDNGSANGIYVNGERTQRCVLNYWDEIQIFNHVLRFMALAKLPGEKESVVDQSSERPQQEATMEVDIASLGDLVDLRRRVNVPSLALMGAQQMESSHPLDKVNFTIGKASNCDMHVPGWLAPRLAARIQRRTEGFYLIPGRRGKVSVNGTLVSQPVKLADDDDLRVRGLALKFYFRPMDDG
jgi:predicted component of type VI protein secretion system